MKSPSNTNPRHGFTLIELLIVVAIIAILAAIAVPNFLEAQVRAKVSRTMNDMRTVTVAIESYTVDHNVGPSDNGQLINGVTRPYGSGPPNNRVPAANFTIGYDLTTPISYLSSTRALRDPFKEGRSGFEGILTDRDLYQFANWRARLRGTGESYQAAYGILTERTGEWVLWGAGPDQYTNNSNFDATNDFQVVARIPYAVSYDPTNGTLSIGDIHRTQKFGVGILENPNPLP